MIQTIIGHAPAIVPTAAAGVAATLLYRQTRDSWSPPARVAVGAGLAGWAAIIAAAAWAVIG